MLLTTNTYIAAGTALPGDTTTWLDGGAFNVPSGIKSLSFAVNWTHGGVTSQVEYRILVGHSPAIMAVSPIRNSSPSISGDVAEQVEYQSQIQPVETGEDAVFFVPFDVTSGVQYIKFQIRQKTKDGGGNGTVGVTVSGSY